MRFRVAGLLTIISNTFFKLKTLEIKMGKDFIFFPFLAKALR
jgi:hypothetical protein